MSVKVELVGGDVKTFVKATGFSIEESHDLTMSNETGGIIAAISDGHWIVAEEVNDDAV